jgi:hypothetical protein
MARALFAFVSVLLLATRAGAEFYQFTGTLSIHNGSPDFLPRNAEVSGSGVGFSSRFPINEIRSFGGVSGFTGSAQTKGFLGTAGFVMVNTVELDGIGNPAFAGAPLRGKMRVPGLYRQKYSWGQIFLSTPLTQAGTTGLGLGGTRPIDAQTTSSLRFATWTTGSVSEMQVLTGPSTFMAMTGTIKSNGFDLRTPAGLGVVQFVTPVRAEHQFITNRAAFAVLRLVFAPEPRRGLLLLAGSLAVLWLGAIRRGVRR